MEKEEKQRLAAQLYRVLAAVTDAGQMERLLDDLCTFTEVEQMAQRIECAKLLAEGYTYNRIISMTEISSATLSRVSRCLQHGSGGYSELLPPLLSIAAT